MDEFVLVIKINKKNEIVLNEFYDFLKKEDIEYKEKLEEKWEGIRQTKYIANIAFYVKEIDEAKVKEFIRSLQNSDIQIQEHEELKMSEEEIQLEKNELEKHKKRKKALKRVMVYGIFGIIIIGVIIGVIGNFKN